MKKAVPALALLLILAFANFTQEEYAVETILSGEITYFDISKSDPAVIYAVKRSGIQRTADGGETWKEVFRDRFKAVSIHAEDPRTVYAIEPG